MGAKDNEFSNILVFQVLSFRVIDVGYRLPSLSFILFPSIPFNQYFSIFLIQSFSILKQL